MEEDRIRSKLRGTGKIRIELVRWLILIAYVVILYVVASEFWHIQKFWYWLVLFLLLPFLIMIAFKFLKSKDEPTREDD